MGIGGLEVECKRDDIAQDGTQVSGLYTGMNSRYKDRDGTFGRQGSSVCFMVLLRCLWEPTERYPEGN